MKFFSQRGYFVGSESAAGILTIGGECGLVGAVSPNTGKLLTQHARLEIVSDYLWLDDWPDSDVHFLYSWKCAIHEGDFSYRYTGEGIEILEYKPGGEDYSGFPYDGYPTVFEARSFDLKPLSQEEQAIVIELNDPDCDPDYVFEEPLAERLSIPAHQFGGIPFLLESLRDSKHCVVCGSEMEILASIGNESYSNEEGFFGNEFVQLLYFVCRACHVVSVINRAD